MSLRPSGNVVGKSELKELKLHSSIVITVEVDIGSILSMTRFFILGVVDVNGGLKSQGLF